jgi:rhomboid family GlyGly-CTERM serine protease
MGLFNRNQSGLSGYLRDAAYWQVAAVLLLVCLAVAAMGDAGREVLKYERLSIEDGEYWRLATAHFTHLGTTHLLLNMAGLVLVWLLVGRYLNNWQWMLTLTLSMVTVSAGFWFVDIYMLWYVGLSGVLHGLLLAGTVLGFHKQPSESAIIVVVVIGKLAWEQLAGPLPGSESVSGGDVVVNAHLFGAIGGLVTAAILWRSVSGQRSI